MSAPAERRCAARTQSGGLCRNFVFEDGLCRTHYEPLAVLVVGWWHGEAGHACPACGLDELPEHAVGVFVRWTLREDADAVPLCRGCLGQRSPVDAHFLDVWTSIADRLSTSSRSELHAWLTNELDSETRAIMEAMPPDRW